MTNGTSQGLFIVVAIIIFGIFVGLSYTLFGNNLQSKLVDLFETSTNIELNEPDSSINLPVDLESVYFEDKILEQLIREELKISKEETITTAKMEELKVFKSIQNLEVKSLVGLEYASNLNTLYIHNTNVENLLPISNLKNLKILLITSNPIIDISPLANLTNITFINAQHNKILDISPLANLIELETLMLNGNEISDISPLIRLKRLTRIALDANKISDYSVLDMLPDLTNISK